MAPRHKILLLVAFLLLGVISVAVVDFEPEISELRPPSTYSTLPNGYRALFVLLRELDLPVSRMLKPLSRLGATDGTLIVMDPLAIPVSAREMKHLKKWVRRGNTLIVFGGRPKPQEYLAFLPKKKNGSKKRGATDRPSLAEKLDLNLRESDVPSRKALTVASARLFGVHRLSVSTAARWKSKPKKWDTILRDSAGPIILAKKMGDGEVVAISDSGMAANKSLGLEQNVRLVTALLMEKGKPHRILFDEYHHGFAAAESFWHYVGSSIFGWILLQIFLAGVLYFSSQRASFAGRFRSLDRPSGRSSLEYVDSMANVFESAGAATLALQAMLRRFLNQVSQRTGIPSKQLEKEVRENRGIPAGKDRETSTLIHACHEAIQSGADTAETLALARRLAAARVRLGVRRQ